MHTTKRDHGIGDSLNQQRIRLTASNRGEVSFCLAVVSFERAMPGASSAVEAVPFALRKPECSSRPKAQFRAHAADL